MIEVLYHDVEAATAVIQVVSGGTTLTDNYNLLLVFPGTKQVLQTLGLEFTEAAQLKAIEYVGRQMELQMAGGTFPGDPEGNPIIDVEPPEAPEPDIEPYVQEEPAPPVEQAESVVPMPEVEPPAPEQPEPIVEETDDGDAELGSNQPEPG